MDFKYSMCQSLQWIKNHLLEGSVIKTSQYLEGHNRPKWFKFPLIGLSTISQDPHTQERNQDYGQVNKEKEI